MLKLILASASPRRAELLRQIGIDFSIAPADVDESTNGFSEAGKYAMEMSKRKALQVSQTLKDNLNENLLVLGSDTVVSVDNRIFGKPSNRSQAQEMLKAMENRWHVVTTGMTLIRPKTMQMLSETEITRVKMSDFSQGFIEKYISTKEPYDKAGGYAIQEYGSIMVECIDGCYFIVVGLPLHRLSKMFSKFGYNPLSWV